MYYPTIAHIDLEALHYNLNKIKASASKSNILAMVKRDAYGHGAVEVAKRIENDVDAFGVVFLQEALLLNNAKIKKPIVVTSGFFDKEELSVIDKFNFECEIHNFEQIRILEHTKLKNPLKVWFKIDTGMHRLGFQFNQVSEAYQKLMQNNKIEKPLRLVTHFSDADDISSDKTAKQIALFEKITEDLAGEWCVANSAAILNWPKTHKSWIRPGIMLYGASPFKDKTGLDLNLKPVMTLTSHIIAIHNLEKGEAVGYGGIFTCPEKMRIGTVSIGYGDGYSRNIKSEAPVLVDGMRTKLVGRVAMDMIGVDLRTIPNAKVGTTVTLWGRGLPVEEIAAHSDGFQYELLSRLTSRVYHKFYQHSSDLRL